MKQSEVKLREEHREKVRRELYADWKENGRSIKYLSEKYGLHQMVVSRVISEELAEIKRLK